MKRLMKAMHRLFEAAGRVTCVKIHSRLFWRPEWISEENRFEVRCPRCGRVY
jgi:hypothetical protein